MTRIRKFNCRFNIISWKRDIFGISVQFTSGQPCAPHCRSKACDAEKTKIRDLITFYLFILNSVNPSE